MKKIILLTAFLCALVFGVSAIQYQPIIFNAQYLDQNNQTMNADPDKSLTVLDNWQVGISRNSARTSASANRREWVGKLSKIPGWYSYYTLGAAGRGRGIYHYQDFTGSTTNNYIMAALCTPEYTATKVYAGTVELQALPIELPALFSSPYHYFFEDNYDSFRDLSTLYMANGATPVKWFSSTSSNEYAMSIQDTGNTAAAVLVPGILYFKNGSKIVTGESTSFLMLGIHKGRWIRANAAAGVNWYEVESCTSETSLTLRLEYTGTTTSSAAVQRSYSLTVKPKLILRWKDRLWIANVLDYARNSVYCSAVVSSTTPAGLEDFSGGDSNDTGNITISDNANGITGLAATDDYLFIFKDKNYYVYKYNADLLPPIELVRKWDRGCSAPNTIKNVDNGIVYHSKTGVRYTNGFSDQDISGSIGTELRYNNFAYDMSFYYSGTSNDNNFPLSYYDSYDDKYNIYFPGNDKGFIYDVTAGNWVGSDTYTKPSCMCSYDLTGTNACRFPVFISNARTNEVGIVDDTYSAGLTNLRVCTGEIQSADMTFGDTKRLKKVYWLEAWFHPAHTDSITTDATMALDYYADGVQMLNAPLTSEVVNTSQISNYYKKIRWAVNTVCNFFRWRLRDTATDSLYGENALIGGNIGFDYLDGNN